MISTRSDEFPPVQLSGSPALRVTVEGSGELRVKGVPRLIDAVKLSTSLPPAPDKVYVPATMVALVEPGMLTGRPSSPSVRL